VPGRDHLPWPEIRGALEDIGYRGPWVIEAFNPGIREIARAVSLWRPLAESQDAIAVEGLAFLSGVVAHEP
jgi:D-psicose/D-tagatose/L-ribulose 3-epimerase